MNLTPNQSTVIRAIKPIIVGKTALNITPISVSKPVIILSTVLVVILTLNYLIQARLSPGELLSPKGHAKESD